MISRLLPFLAFFIPILSWGSHNRGGEITYLHLGGLTYEFTITTCTDLGSATGADRPELYLDFDLGTPYAQRDTIFRVSQQPLSINHQKNMSSSQCLNSKKSTDKKKTKQKHFQGMSQKKKS